jgi:hypothetical protein
MLVHQEIVTEHHEERALYVLKGCFNGVSNPHGLMLDMNVNLDIRHSMEQ